MPPKKPVKDRPEEETPKPRPLEVLIGQHVMLGLGQPGDLQRVQVRSLWENHYRVNIFTGADSTSIKLAHSFFLKADHDGNIAESTPQITKHY